MPKFTFTSPEGKKYTVSAPEGSTQQDAMGYLAQNNKDFADSMMKSITKDVVSNPLRKTGTEFDKTAFESLPSWRKVSKSVAHGGEEAVKGLGRTVGLVPEELPVEGADRRAMEQQMAAATPGGRASQIYGNLGATAPLMALPAAPGARLASSVAQGGLQGLMSGGSEGERAASMGMGMGLGALIPKAADLVRGTYRRINPMQSAGRVVSKTLEQAGDLPATELASALRTSEIANPAGTAVTAGQVTGNPVLQGLERGSRARQSTAPSWGVHDAAQNERRFQYLRDLEGNTAHAEQVAKEARDTATEPLLNDFHANFQNGQPGFTAGESIRSRVGPTADDIQAQVSKLGPDTTSQEIHQIRKNIAQSSDPDAGRVKEIIDDALNRRSGGRWQKYVDTYTQASAPVDEAKALQNVKKTVWDEKTGTPVGAALGQTPQVSGEAITNVLRKGGQGPFVDPLQVGSAGPSATGRNLRDLATEEGAASAWRQTPSAAPLESNPVSEGAKIAVGGAVPGVVGVAARKAANVFQRESTQRALADLLRDPQKLATVLEQVNKMPAQTQNPLVQMLRQTAVQGIGGMQNAP